ncbi:MAG: type I 3-dehydroquinate dehydratase [Deltaproteobacteria bacterium]|nr:MAG: type I 3-dehydroquinate dehydratase [Deltaproteobacteria bacterium]
MPRRICVSIGKRETESVIAAAEKVKDLADVIEIRLDYLASPAVGRLAAEITLPLIFTNRPIWEGGHFAGSEAERIAPLAEAVQMQAAYIDLELTAPHASRKFLQARLAGTNTRLILSSHDFNQTADFPRLADIVTKMQESGADIGKLVTTAQKPADNLRLLKTLEIAADKKFPLIAFCMGRHGAISRVASCDFGGYMTYCSLDDMDCTAPGQITLDNMMRIFALTRDDRP